MRPADRTMGQQRRYDFCAGIWSGWFDDYAEHLENGKAIAISSSYQGSALARTSSSQAPLIWTVVLATGTSRASPRC